MREWCGTTHDVVVVEGGFTWRGETWRSLSTIAEAITGSHWSGPRFFGLGARSPAREPDTTTPMTRRSNTDTAPSRSQVRCAIYTRKSSEEGLEQDFNSLDARREACEAYVRSQMHEGWVALPQMYDDGGISGGTLERPALQRLLADIKAGRIEAVVV